MKNKDKFISLQEATNYCSYSQEYLSLRARQGKLKSSKIGRNWVTKKEWVEEYLKTLGSEKIEPKKTLQIKRNEPPINLPIETLIKPLNISLNVIPRPIIRLRFALVFILVLFLGGLFLLNKIDSKILPEKIKNTGQELSIALLEINSKENQASTIKTFERYGQWLKENLESRAPGLKTVYLATDNFINKKLFQFGRFIAHPFFKVYRSVFLTEERPKSEEEPREGELKIEEPEKLETKEGVVVVPVQNQEEQTIKKIKDSFSDEVKVEIQDETSGFIIPVFKEKEGEKYLYIMVPVNN